MYSEYIGENTAYALFPEVGSFQVIIFCRTAHLSTVPTHLLIQKELQSKNESL